MKKITFLFLVLFTIIATSQTNKNIDWREMGNNLNATFYEVQENFYEYWKGKTPEKGKGYKPFKRWESYMEERVYPSGDMSLPSYTYSNFMEWQVRNNTARDANSNLATSNWTEVGPIGSPSGPLPYTRTGAGRVNFVRFDPNNSSIMYVGAPDGGLWKSTNGGSSWTTNTDFLTVIGCSDLAIDPTNTDIMYLATGDLENDRRSIGILKSIDGGTTWNTTSLVIPPENGWKISKLLMDPNDPLNMIAASNLGVFVTTDGWDNYTFNSLNGDYPDLKDMEFKPGDPNTVYAAGSTFWKSTDFGNTWVQITSGIPTSDVRRIALGVTPGNNAYVYALIANATDSGFKGLYRSTDSGTTFSTMATSPNLLGYETDGSDSGGQGFYDLAVVVSPTNPNIVTTGGVNHWQSTDGGVNWVNTSYWASGEVHADVHELNYLPGSSTTMYSCHDGGIHISTDNGNNWTDISNNLAIGQVVKLGLSANIESIIVAGEQDNGTNLKTGTSWDNIYGGDGGECFIDYTNNNTIYIQYVQGAYARSDDGGASATSIVSGLPSGIDFYSPFKMDPVDNNRIYSGGTQTLYTSANKGDTWNALATSTGSGSITDFVIAPSNPSIIYTVQTDAISKSTDAGTTFSNVTGSLPNAAALKSITVSNTDPDKVWVIYSGYTSSDKVFKSIDGGTTWTNISSGLPNLPMNTIVYRNGSANDELYIGADIGVFIIDNTVSSWLPFSTNLPNVAVRDLEIYYPTGKLRAGTYGRGVWETDVNNNTLDTGEITLSQSDVITLYPNPVTQEFINVKLNNSNDTFNYGVFDILGKQILSGKVDSNNTVISLENESTGFYFIRLTNDKIVFTQKIVID